MAKPISKKKKKPLKKYQGVRVGGKKVTSFKQVKVKKAGKKTTKDRIAGGVKLAIL